MALVGLLGLIMSSAGIYYVLIHHVYWAIPASLAFAGFWEVVDRGIKASREAEAEQRLRKCMEVADAHLEFEILDGDKIQVTSKQSGNRLQMGLKEFEHLFPLSNRRFLNDLKAGRSIDLSPENLGAHIGFLLPAKVRKECFDPFFEELREDRLRSLEVARSAFGRRFIEVCFHVRLWAALSSSVLCACSDHLRKLVPLFKLFR